jgi:hypothetical protein
MSVFAVRATACFDGERFVSGGATVLVEVASKSRYRLTCLISASSSCSPLGRRDAHDGRWCASSA